GLQYAWDVDVGLSITLQVLFAAAYMFFCLYATQKTQMLVSELYTFFYALIMCAVSVGTVEQIVEDITEDISMTNHSQ
ncbi:Chitin synthase 1, partial [Biomphalaria glabrata]